MKLQKRLGALLILIGIGFAVLPLVQQVYGVYSQWQLEREWNAAIRQSQSRLPEERRRADFFTSLGHVFSIRSAHAEPATGSGSSRLKKASRYSTTSRRAAVQRKRHVPKMGPVRLEIPRLNVRAFVVEGTTNRQLMRGPAHFRGTALPGQPGNCAIAGHRNVYGKWFKDLNRLRAGDQIILRTPKQAHTYRVTKSRIVRSNDFSVLRRTKTPTLTLVTCMIPHAKHRLIIFGEKVGSLGV